MTHLSLSCGLVSSQQGHLGAISGSKRFALFAMLLGVASLFSTFGTGGVFSSTGFAWIIQSFFSLAFSTGLAITGGTTTAGEEESVACVQVFFVLPSTDGEVGI